jgi:hypothetical protein
MSIRFLSSGVALGAPIAAEPAQIPTWPEVQIQYRTSLDTGVPRATWFIHGPRRIARAMVSVRALTRKIQRRRWLTERKPRESWRHWSMRVGIVRGERRMGGTERHL